MIPELRTRFNREYAPERYTSLLACMEKRCGGPVEFRVAETPIFLPRDLLHQMARAGIRMCEALLGNPEYLRAARRAVPKGYCVAGETTHPHFLTADFALVQAAGHLEPRLVEIQAFPSVYAYQAVLSQTYRDVYRLDPTLGTFLCKLDEPAYWSLLCHTVLGSHDPQNVVLTEIDPQHQKTRPDFEITARRLGIAVVDISSLEPDGDRLCYRKPNGTRIPIRRIYNRAIADELMARQIRLPFDLERPWNVEWAGHPNWYFLISKFSIPWLASNPSTAAFVPPAVFLHEFLEGDGHRRLLDAGVELPPAGPTAVYHQLLLKPLFSFAGKGIRFDPTHAELEAIPPAERSGYLLQQRMHFVPTIETPFGLTQAEIRILYLWPDRSTLTPALSLVRLGRGKMMGVDHNRNQEWVGGSAAFYR
ncbi:MAG TPA: hypothetical protein VG267_00920 [Terracidiphilus sp.]|nr:hypothetical protein [Terracidiphilus sp.]